MSETKREMGSNYYKAHAVCIPFPAQGHITPMLKLAKLLHHRGFHITFVNTEFNHKRLLRSRGTHSLDGLPDFRFEKIPDGLPHPTDPDATQDIPSICESTSKNCLDPFQELLGKLNGGSSPEVPPVTCIVADGVMSFALDAAEQVGIPIALLWSMSACGFLAYMQYDQLVQRGFVPLKDESQITNGYLDTVLDWIPGMKDIRLRDFPSFVRTTDPCDVMLNFLLRETRRAFRASAIILNTFDALENEALNALSSIFPEKIYTIGPLHLLLNQIPQNIYSSIGSNLWIEKDPERLLQWLSTKEPNSVVYVNYGSITMMTARQLLEFAWGLANSGQNFLWIIRPDLVRGQSGILPPAFIEETKERGLLSSWCSQEEVLKHPSVGGFLMHNGWNSTLESISSGVPMICWPFFAEQQTNCRFSCREWGVGMEIEGEVKREEVEKLVRELMEGKKGKEMRKKAMEWKRMAEESASDGGMADLNMEKLVKAVLLREEQ